MTDRPSGTVTFLFSDIEGSTALLEALGAARYATVLDVHRRIVRQVIDAHGGSEVDTQGDAFFVAFSRARDAVEAAAGIQRGLAEHPWPEDRPVAVRIGLHTSEATPTDEGYVGMGVHRGARIGAAAHGGQVLVSQVAADLVRDEIAPYHLTDLGEHRLKDFVAAQRLFQLGGEGLRETFPPLRTVERHPSNLPVQPTPLVGRQRELAELAAVLGQPDVRFVTLTGPGGCGKTRLAIRAAADRLQAHPDGVFLVDLSAVSDSSLVLPAIAQAIGVSEASGQSLTPFLAGKSVLLVLDNFEQVMGAAPEVASLISAAVGCRVVATSREPLRVAAEHVVDVGPLRPDDAEAMFEDRGAAVDAAFSLTDGNRSVVAEICARLDGLPLAIELAAARIGLLSPNEILSRLDRRLSLLTGGARDRPSRQRTLRATLEWSHDLLDERERRLFAALGVFAGSFSVGAVERVCNVELDVIGSLVDKSLVRRDGDRLRLLDTVHEFAAERLDASGEADALHRRHGAEYERLAEEAYAGRHRQQGLLAAMLESDHENLRAALDWFADAEPARAVRLAGALGWFWHLHSHLTEGRSRIARALETEDAGSVDDRARALSAAAELAGWQGDIEAASVAAHEAIAAWETLDRPLDVALTRHELGWAYFFAGDAASARTQMEESLRIQAALGDELLTNRAQLGLLQTLVAMGELDEVKRLGPRAVELSRKLGDVYYEHFAHHFIADCALMEGRYAEARDGYRRSLDAAWRSGDRVETTYEIQGSAMAAVGLGQPELALRLSAAADASLAALGVEHLVEFWSRLNDDHVARARAQIGPQRAEAAWREGREIPLEQAVELAAGGER